MKHFPTVLAVLLLVPLTALHAADSLWSHVNSPEELGELRGMTAEWKADTLKLTATPQAPRRPDISWAAEDDWGNPDDTADYAMQMVDEVCAKFGGDRENIVLTGFSRVAIACGYIGLRNDHIAALWKGFHACQHYDGAGWNGATMTGAIERSVRFQGKAVFQTDNPQEKFQPVMDAMKTHATWATSGLGFHSTAMFLDDRLSTQQLRDWFWELVGKTSP